MFLLLQIPFAVQMLLGAAGADPAVARAGGKLLWKYPTNGWIYSSPILTHEDETLLIGSDDVSVPSVL